MTIENTQILEENLFALFARQARRRPDATAVIDESGETSYRALQERACRIAGALALRGLGAEQPVGVLMHRTTDLIAALLGVLRAGGCYVPLDPDDPPERARRIVSVAGCKLVLGHESLLEELRVTMSATAGAPEDLALLDIEELGDGPAASRSPGQIARGGDRLAYILFTSGSTGMPKGVEVEHRNVVNLLLAGIDLLGVTDSDRYLATSTVGFDSSVAEMYLPLITGGTVILHDRTLVMDPRRLAGEIRKHGVTVLMTGPSVWSVALATVPNFPRLRVLITHGEAVSRDLARRLADLGDSAWNLYGPTETTVWATGHKLGRDEPAEAEGAASAPIGRPLGHVEVRVLDEKLAPVPPGAEGELWIGGPAVARGYRGDDALTSERFARFGDNGSRFYRTGDVIAMDASGTIHYFGRNDDQLKVRGVRIEPMEVESAVLGHPGVDQAAATWFPTRSGSRSIVAGVVLKPGVDVTSRDLHDHLTKLLPPSMVPSRFVFCEALPLLPSGKIDRAAIRDRSAETPDEAAPATKGGGATETERILIGIWERILGVRPVHRTDHFFTIGGDSLSAVTVILEIETAFEISLTVRALFEAPTLDRLADRVDRERSQPDDLPYTEFIFPLVEQGHGRPVFFCNPALKLARKGLWTVDCPLYAVTLWAHGKGFVKARSVEELAHDHIELMRSIQREGPYRLAGYSFGGLVALEIARQLRGAGEEIELLFLLDPSEPFEEDSAANPDLYERKNPCEREGFAERMKRHVSHLARNPADTAPYVLTRAFDQLPQRFREWVCYQVLDQHGRHANIVSTRFLPKNRWPAFWYASKRLGKSYVPRPYDGEALAIFVNREEGYAVWKPLLDSTAEISFVESEHSGSRGLFSDQAIPKWIETLRARLDGAV